MNADPEVRRWFSSTLTREESDAQAALLQNHIATHGFGFWAVEVPGVAPFVGFVGLQHVGFTAPFTPAVEAGWRLSRAHWGQGYATEAARACMGLAFESFGADKVISLIRPENVPSRRVAEKNGMTCEKIIVWRDYEHCVYAKKSVV